jgi:glycosyltransferase involved in cell wall biosynthesis
MGVIGAHGEQYVRRDLPNVLIQDHTVNMCRDVWARTKILIMPSIYESYGMTGVEACYQGIPVLANPTPGLVESLGGAGWFIDRPDVDSYTQAVENLFADDALWQERSALALTRGSEIDAQAELDQFVRHVELRATVERNNL